MWRSAQKKAAFPNFQWTPQALDGGPSGCLGPLAGVPEEFDDPPLLEVDACWLDPDDPPPRFLPLLPPLPPLLEEVAATSAPVLGPEAEALERVDTTDADALLEVQTESALSNTASYVSWLNSMSAIELRTT